MDEPCSALDPMATLKIEELITALVKEYTIVIVTHNMQQAGRVSHFTGFFLNGGLVEYAPTQTLWASKAKGDRGLHLWPFWLRVSLQFLPSIGCRH